MCFFSRKLSRMFFSAWYNPILGGINFYGVKNMHNRGSIARFISVCFICIFIICYGFYTAVFDISDTSAAVFKDKGTLSSEIEDLSSGAGSSPSENIKIESSVSAAASAESILTSASGVVKGKILSRYISPYSAPSSYNNTYMKNNTELNIDIKGLLAAELPYKIEKSDLVQVLIMHTHTTESFMTTDSDCYDDTFTSRSRDENLNMVKIGNIVAEKLNAAGIKTLHDTTQHDYPEYNGSYSRAAETICSYLKKYPGIKIVMDLHRDAISSNDTDKVKVVTEINGKKAAQVMIVMGSQSGNVKNFPDWQENLKLALRLQQTLEVMYPTLARPLSLNSKNYNESLTTGSVLIEFGTDANTLEEACYSAEMVGNAAASLLNTLT